MKLAGKSVLVTGGAGFIGSHLVDRVIGEKPANLVVVDNLFLGKEANLAPAFDVMPSLRMYREDISDYDVMCTIMRDEATEVVFNLAVIPLPTSLERPRWTIDVNVGSATVVAELLRQGAYQTLVHFSSSEVYGTAQRVPMDEDHPLAPLTPYAASKAAADHIVLSYHHTFGLDVALLRPFNTFGPRQNESAYAGVIPRVLERAFLGREVTVDGDGHQTRDFSYVQDVADAAVRVYEEPRTRGQVMNVASGKEVSVNALVAELLEVSGSAAGVVHGPPRLGDVRRHLGSPARLQALTDWRPSVGLRPALESTVAWYRAASSAKGAEGPKGVPHGVS